MLSLMKITCVNPTVKFTIPEDCGIEKQVEQRETKATCEAEEGSPQSHSKVEASVVPLLPGEHHIIALISLKYVSLGVPFTRYDYEDMVVYVVQVAEEVDPHELSTYKKFVIGTEYVQWLAAMGDEMESLQKNQTWEIARRALGRKVMTCK